MADNLIEEILARVLKLLGESYYGKYRGFVHRNDDPERRGRLRLLVPSVLKDQPTDWALPCFPFGGLKDQGMFMVPEEKARVWVEFEEGDKDRPVWTGTFWPGRGEAPSEAAARPRPSTRLLKTPSGHLIRFDDENDKERFCLRLNLPKTANRGKPARAEITIDEKGGIELLDAKGSRVLLDAGGKAILVQDAAGNKVTLSSAGIVVGDCNRNLLELSSAGIRLRGQKILLESDNVLLGSAQREPLIAKGRSFIRKYMTHVHPTTSPGKPTEVPVPQGEPGTLSKKVKST